MNKIAIVEDEADLRNLLKLHLEKESYEILQFVSGDSFLDFIDRNDVDLVILDLMLPGTDGLEICKILRKNSKTKSLPIIMLTAKSSEADIVVGLELGADDYMVKPFSMRELIARVKALLRRTSNHEKHEILRVDNIELFPERYLVKVDGQEISFTTTEFQILEMLMLKKDRVLTRNRILEALGGERQYVIDRTVDVHVLNIRKKLGKYGRLIQTIRGVGYKMLEE